MSKNQRTIPAFIEQLDCFGDYNRVNPLCVKHCALRLRCVIEQEHYLKTELLSELAEAEDMMITIQ